MREVISWLIGDMRDWIYMWPLKVIRKVYSLEKGHGHGPTWPRREQHGRHGEVSTTPKPLKHTYHNISHTGVSENRIKAVV